MKTWIGCLVLVLAMGCNERSRLALKAEYGTPAAQREYGKWLWSKGPERDIPEATSWLTKAAEGGDVEAMYKLGKIRSMGGGLTSPQPEAVMWFQKGAEAGDPYCMVELAAGYRYGWMGVEVDEAKFRYWMAKADAVQKERAKTWGR